MKATELQTIIENTETAIVTRDNAWGQKQSAELLETVAAALVEDAVVTAEKAAEIDSELLARIMGRVAYAYCNTNAVYNRLVKAKRIVPDPARKSRGGLDLTGLMQ